MQKGTESGRFRVHSLADSSPHTAHSARDATFPTEFPFRGDSGESPCDKMVIGGDSNGLEALFG